MSRDIRLVRGIATRSLSIGSGRAYTLGRSFVHDPRWSKTVPRPLPTPLRQAIWRRFQAGQDVATITEALGLEPRTVRRLVGRFRQAGPAAVAPSYDRCGSLTPKPAESLVRAAVGLRQEHPTWGAGLIRVMLHRGRPDQALPAVRTLQRWFERAGLSPAPPGRRPAADPRRARRPHEVWQMDAAERVKLRTGQLISWLRIADECSGAVLLTAVFPAGPLDSGPARGDPGATAAGLRSLGPARAAAGGQRGAVGHAGRPADGPGIVVARRGGGGGADPPRRPQANGVVERSQGTAKRWGEPWTCDSPGELQRRLHEMDRIQRQEYPSIAGRSRGQAFPRWSIPGGLTRRSGRRPTGACRWSRRSWPATRCVGG